MREAVYERARAALGRQLTAVEPPLSTREIEAQHQELEDAIARLEADYLPSDSGPTGLAAEPGGYEPHRQDTVSPNGTGTAPAFEHRDESYGDDDDDGDEEDFVDERRRSRTPLIAAAVGLVAVLAVAAYGYAERETIMATLGMSGSGPEETEDNPPIQVVTPVQRSVDAADPATGPDKRLDRLTNGANDPAPAPPGDPAAQPAPGVTDAPASEPADDPLGDLAAADPAAADPALPPGQPAPGEPVPPEAAPPPGQQAAVQPPPPPGADALVAQRAIYYFQGTEGQPGRAAEGTATWTQITRDNAPAVQATLRLNDQDVVTTVTVYKNSDPNLPASHLVEVQFQGSLGASPVQRVPALVLKQTEQARGQPLTGAAVPVTPDLFWIALADDPAQSARNLQLLREGSWFDIPILFNDGTRALLTFEKGIPGDRIFETVLAAWTPT